MCKLVWCDKDYRITVPICWLKSDLYFLRVGLCRAALFTAVSIQSPDTISIPSFAMSKTEPLLGFLARNVKADQVHKAMVCDSFRNPEN